MNDKAFSHWVANTIADCGGDGAEYLGSKAVDKSHGNVYYFPCQVLNPQDTTEAQSLCFHARNGTVGSAPESKDFGPFCVPDRPKHDSWLPQVGQNFKNRDTVASNGKGQFLKPVGLAEYTSPGTCEGKHVYPLCGVNPMNSATEVPVDNEPNHPYSDICQLFWPVVILFAEIAIGGGLVLLYLTRSIH